MIEKEYKGVKLRVYTSGKIESFYWNKWRELDGCVNKKGYCIVGINKKIYTKHRIIYWAWNSHKFDISDPKQEIDHINNNRLDNRLCNLDAVSHQQNLFNKNAKGYNFHKTKNKWRAYITIGYRRKHLGYFETEDESRNAHLKAKNELHLIAGRVWV